MSDEDWNGRRVLVLGLGDTGLSALRRLEARGARLRAADTRAQPPALGAVRERLPHLELALGAFGEALLEGMDAVVASPGVALREPVLQAALRRGIEVLGDVEIFGREVGARAPGSRVIGVTGTNGKSTVTALAAAMGAAAGLRTVACGNIGLPVLDALDSPEGERA
ncbi:MAG: UDP-N-acetylmuramoyl-L-alanine--D-glutamate ligase, partial [Microvirga sp.]